MKYSFYAPGKDADHYANGLLLEDKPWLSHYSFRAFEMSQIYFRIKRPNVCCC